MDAIFKKLVARHNGLVARCEALFIEKPAVLRTTRVDAALRYLMLIFDHHRGIVIMVGSNCRSSAFSLIRPITETFNRLHVAMYGTDKQFQALLDDSYRTEYKTEGQLVDEVSGFEPLFGPLFEDLKESLHGFTHAGVEHLARMSTGKSIGPSYSDEDTSSLLFYVTSLALLAGPSTARFLERTELETSCNKLLDEFLAVDA